MQASTAVHSQTHSEQLHLHSALTLEITRQIDFAYNILIKRGHLTRPYTKSAVATLLSFSEERQLQVLENAKKLLGVLSSIDADPQTEVDPATEVPELESNVDEIALTKKALSCFGFRMKDSTWEQTSEDHLIEIYNSNGVQLHRSLNFFKTCGYSLLDLCVHEWYVLWERPSQVLKKLNEIVGQVLTGAPRPGTRMDVGPHLVRETYDDGTTQPFHPRSMVVQFKDMYPAFNANDQICGFVVTSLVKTLTVGDDVLKVDFI